MSFRWTGWPASLLWMTRARPQASDRPGLQALLPSREQDWRAWDQAVAHHEVEPQILRWIETLDLEVPSSIVARLKRKAASVQAQDARRWQTGAHLLREADGRGLSFVLLKGNAIADDIYGEAAYKRMNDIDFLIRVEDRDAWWSLIEELGYRAAASVGSHPRAREKHSHHWPPLFSPGLECFLGVHWGLVSPLRKERLPVAEMWNRIEVTTSHGLQVRRLAPEDFLLHLCAHLSPTKVGLREIGDVVNAIEFFADRLDFMSFARLAERSKCADSVFRACGLVASLYACPFAEKVRDLLEAQASRPVRRELRERTRDPLTFLWSRTSLISKIEKNYALFSITDDPKEKAYFLSKMWRYFLVPPLKEARRFCFVPEGRGPVADLAVRIKTPLRVSRALASEMGWPLFVAVTLKHEADLAAALPKALRNWSRGEKIRGLRDVAQEAGVDPDALREMRFVE